jgi:thioredoxin reductase
MTALRFLIPFAVAFCFFATVSSEYNEYCIVGAGPAGVQLGIFMEKAQRDYVIFESTDAPGSFFVRYPRHRQLISINKRYTGDGDAEFNLRHDWNSLIVDEDKLLYKHYSEDYWPHADTMLTYLRDVAQHYKLKIRYNSLVEDVERVPVDDGQEFTMKVGAQNWRCKTLVMATGLAKELPPESLRPEDEKHWDTYQDMSVDIEQYRNKTVLIAGRGNGAFETAMHIEHVAARILMIGRSRIRLAWETHYVGDLRAVNNRLLDAYLLKSHDGIMEVDVFKWNVRELKNGRKMLWNPGWNNASAVHLDAPDNGWNNIGPSGRYEDFLTNHPHRWKFDKLIRCTGWSHNFSTYKKSTLPEKQHRKYPKMDTWYQSTTSPGMYFIGTIAHSRDWRKSSGGFIHGFRYTVRALHKILEWRLHGNKWPVEQEVENTAEAITDAILYRNNRASGTYQMFSELRDVMILPADASSKALYLFEIPKDAVVDVVRSYSPEGKLLKYVEVSLEYNKNYHGPEQDVFAVNRAVNTPKRAEASNFLHPFLRLYHPPKGKAEKKQGSFLCETWQGMEDLHGDWANPWHHRKYAIPFMQRALNGTCGQRRNKELDEEATKQIDMATKAMKRLVEMFRAKPHELQDIMLDHMPEHFLQSLVNKASENSMVSPPPTQTPSTCGSPDSVNLGRVGP